jgi:hypothetical protein
MTWIKLDTMVMVVILIQEGLVSSGKFFLISSRVRRYEKLLLAIVEYILKLHTYMLGLANLGV